MKGDIRMLRLRDREHAWVDINTLDRERVAQLGDVSACAARDIKESVPRRSLMRRNELL
jgi:hypothetical protein